MTVDLNPKFTFDSLVQCDFNQLAAAAAKTVVRSPGSSYNPLLIVGESGLGKTHLLMAVGNHALSGSQGFSVEYVSLHTFAESCRASVAAGEIEAFRNRFADVDIVMFDDVQLVEGQKEIQRELARVVQRLRDLGRQVVLASDKHPGTIAGVESELLGSLTAGLSVDITQPNRSERRAILERALEGGAVQLAADALDVVADPELGNLREMFNLLRRLVAFQAVSNEPMDGRIASDVIKGRLSAPFRGGVAPTQQDAGPAGGGSEFSRFFDGIASALTSQIDSWGDRLQSAIHRWRQAGYDVGMLEEAAQHGESPSFADVIAEYETAVLELQKLEERAAELAGGPVRCAAFRDPRALDEARLTVAEVELYGSLEMPAPTPGWTLDGFVAGASNSEALECAEGVLGDDGRVRYPLVIQGPVGVGKSHLLHALANRVLADAPEAVCCLSTHDLFEELAHAGVDRREVWLHRYRRMDAIFLDDFQLAVGHDGVEVVALMLQAAVDSATRVVLTLNAPLEEIENLDQGLRDVLAAGRVVALDRPDRGLRRDLAEARFSKDGIDPPGDLVDYLADRHVSSLRELQSQIQRVIDAAARDQRELTPGFAREVLEGSRPARRRSSVGVRASGIMLAPGVGIRSPEKTVWVWPELADRMIEDLG